MRLIFIRHPRTEANEKKLVYGRTDALYSQSGLATIPGIVAALHDIRIDKLYTSPLTRTRLLACAIGEDHGIMPEDIAEDERIIEMDFGLFENKTIPQLRQQYPEEYGQYIKQFEEYAVPQGESYRQVYHRVGAFLEEIYEIYETRSAGGSGAAGDNSEDANEKKRQPAERTNLAGTGRRKATGQQGQPGQQGFAERTVVAVAHSMVIHAALAHLLHLNLSDVWHIKVEPGSIVDLDYRCGFAMLQELKGPYNVREAVQAERNT